VILNAYSSEEGFVRKLGPICVSPSIKIFTHNRNLLSSSSDTQAFKARRLSFAPKKVSPTSQSVDDGNGHMQGATCVRSESKSARKAITIPWCRLLKTLRRASGSKQACFRFEFEKGLSKTDASTTSIQCLKTSIILSNNGPLRSLKLREAPFRTSFQRLQITYRSLFPHRT
jgi:hypothetical protein